MELTEEQKHAENVPVFASQLEEARDIMQAMLMGSMQSLRVQVVKDVSAVLQAHAPPAPKPINHDANAIMPRAPEPYSVVYTQPAAKEPLFAKPAAQQEAKEQESQ